MKHILLKTIITAQSEPKLANSFSIRDVQELIAGNSMVQQLHRHDFFFILAIKKGKGNHGIDFTSHVITDQTIFCIRSGQVLELQQ